MVRLLCRGLALLVVVRLLCSVNAETPREASPETKARYQAAFQKIAKSYQNSSGTVAHSGISIKEGKPTGGVGFTLLHFSRSPGMLRVDKTVNENRKGDGQVLKGPSNSEVYNLTTSFAIYASPVDGSFLIDRVQNVRSRDQSALHQKFTWCFDAAYAVASIDLAEKIGDPEWRMLEPSTVERDGKPLTSITIAKATTPTRFEDVKTGTAAFALNVLVDPALNNQVVAYSTVAASPKLKFRKFMSAKLVYAKHDSGMMVPKQLAWEEYLDDPKQGHFQLGTGQEIDGLFRDRVEVDYESWSFTTKKTESFELAAFKLPDVTKVKVADVSRSFDYRWFFVAGFACIVVAVASQVWTKRRRIARPEI